MLQISAGELFDRISILELKRSRLAPAARTAVEQELSAAREERDRKVRPSPALTQLTRTLSMTNRELWELEDALRGCEGRLDFGANFVELARAVYTTNDRRAALKRRIDELLGSELTEQKSHCLPEV